MSHKSGHPTAHDFKEIKMAAISRELDELRTLISSLRPENARVAKSGGGYTFCDGCQSPVGGRGDGHDTGIHYMCECILGDDNGLTDTYGMISDGIQVWNVLILTCVGIVWST